MKTITVKDGVEVVQPIVETKRIVLHNIILLDASGSMGYRPYISSITSVGTSRGFLSTESKYEAAMRGINAEIAELRNNKDADIRLSVYEFDSAEQNSERITEHCFAEPISKVKDIKGRGPSGNTPLYQSIGYVIEKFLRTAGNDEQVVLKIFTDGAHNCRWGKYGTPEVCKQLIADVEKNRNFTVTFVGTEEDTRSAIRDLGIDFSNTLTYDGSAQGINTSFMASTNAIKSKIEKLNSGDFSTRSFYNDNTTNDATKSQEVSTGSTDTKKS
jgi:hypothetical protein